MSDDVRLDKWLWAARFFKTRALAREAVTGGKVHLNGQRAKPSRNVKIGDSIDISRGHFRYEITVDAVSDRRGPAREAAKLFTESEESVEKRTAIAQELALRRRVAPIPPASRPDKRSRRRIIRFTRKRED
ncbi:MAG: tRNA synthetase RNA-binding protein [Gammaproteobacteria bacterium SG8_31]|jgi:ribosome-associated heat shock protein Hsp15|nr:MAG: tRNA synthetase RNA-binding protein [Gammaproteobacteria bacterium SG8_31]